MMADDTSSVSRTIERARAALRSLTDEGARISQHAVEKRAGLSNGALNYKCPEYRQFREYLRTLKTGRMDKSVSGEASDDLLRQQVRLKEKYRLQRNELREELTVLVAENAELVHNLMLMQKYIQELENMAGQGRKGVVISFSPEADETE
ncbi:hypothetical protein ABGT23_01580 [Enterobacter cloacae]|uniref:hypothetical protein n=1 Tax=Enterobacter cloacae TaxID=550 RepID=UPI00345C80C2